MNKSVGKVTTNGVILKPHENETVIFLKKQGFDIELIQKSNIKGVHSPDLIIKGEKWEMKAPIGEGNQLMKNTIQKALRQSNNIIIDLRRTKRHQMKCIREIKTHFYKSKHAKKVLIITKGGKSIDFEK